MTTTAQGKSSVVSVEDLLGQQGQLFKRLIKESLQEVLEAEMTEVLRRSCHMRAGIDQQQKRCDEQGGRRSRQHRTRLT